MRIRAGGATSARILLPVPSPAARFDHGQVVPNGSLASCSYYVEWLADLRGALTRVITERDRCLGRGVERVVDWRCGRRVRRVRWERSGCAICAASASGAGGLRNGKEKVYGSIP